MLHDDDPGAIITHNVLCVDECPSQQGADDSEDKEADVGAIGNGAVCPNMDVLAERYLCRNVSNARYRRDQ